MVGIKDNLGVNNNFQRKIQFMLILLSITPSFQKCYF